MPHKTSCIHFRIKSGCNTTNPNRNGRQYRHCMPGICISFILKKKEQEKKEEQKKKQNQTEKYI